MSINTSWYDNDTKRVIILSFIGNWELIEYDAAIEQTLVMLNSVAHPVALVIDLSQSTASARTAEVFRKWLSAIELWRETETYANFWVSVQAKYWNYFLIWMLSQLYNPTSMEVAKNADDAYELAIKLLNKKTGLASDI